MDEAAATAATFLKKNVTTGSIDVHPTENALTINFRIDATILSEEGDRLFGNKKKCQKTLRFKAFDSSTDTKALAENVVHKCKLIDNERLPEIEQILHYLQNRKTSAGFQPKMANLASENDLSSRSGSGSPIFYHSANSEKANLTNLHAYIDMLYDEVPEKVKGTAFLADLASDSRNLEELMQNESLLGALARVFREEWKKSMECTTNIAFIFHCFSNYSQFHQKISHFKVGAQCMQIILHEIKKFEVLKNPGVGAKPTSYETSSPTVYSEADDKKLNSLFNKQNKFFLVALSLLLNLAQEKETEVKIVNRGIVDILCQILRQRLDHFNCAALKDEKSKSAHDLLVLVIAFLKKLSIFAENVVMMAEHKIVEKCTRLLSNMARNERLVENLVRLLFNLSFDGRLRKKMCDSNFLMQIVPYVGNKRLRLFALSLLYHMSMEDLCRPMFTYTDCIPMCVKILLTADERLLIESGDTSATSLKLPDRNDPNDGDKISEKIDRYAYKITCALLINLALNKRNAQLIAGDDLSTAKFLVEKSLSLQNGFLANLLRNMSCHDGPLKLFFVEYIADLAAAVQKTPISSGQKSNQVSCSFFALECLGILTNLNLPDLNFAAFLTESGLLLWLLGQLQSSVHEDDMALEIVMFLGTVSMDEDGAFLLLQNGLVKRLVEILAEKQENDEIVLQTIYVFYQMMLHEKTRRALLDDTDIPPCLIELMHDKNASVRGMCDNTLELIAEYGVEWAQKIQEEKFRWHNAHWLDIVTNPINSSNGRNPDQESRDQSGSSDREFDSDLEPFDEHDEFLAENHLKFEDESESTM